MNEEGTMGLEEEDEDARVDDAEAGRDDADDLLDGSLETEREGAEEGVVV